MSESGTAGSQVGFIAHAQRFAEFVSYLFRRFDDDHCTRAAASLAYTSLLALVPLFTVIFVTISAFPAFQEWRSDIEGFIFRNFVPAMGDQIQSYLVQFTDKAKTLQAFGVMILLVTVLTMMATIESTFNVIWGIRRRRPLIVRFLVYWSVLTLGPLLIGAGMVATSYVISLPLLDEAGVTSDMRKTAIALFPIVATAVAFTMFFKLIPYRPVPLKHALVGGIISSLLFEAAKRIFAYYVTHFPSQQAVYGAFATVPVFLIWIYLSWIVVLLGAEITQCMTTFSAARPKTGSSMTNDPLYCAFRVLARLFEAQRHGKGLSEKALLKEEGALGYDAINRALERLDAGGWVGRNDAYRWVLMRDLHRETLHNLMILVPSVREENNVTGMRVDPLDQKLLESLAAHNSWLNGHMDIALATLFEPRAPAPGVLDAQDDV
ncbi:MAG: YihY family inner membrane protein [Pseudomonadota bacterium]